MTESAAGVDPGPAFGPLLRRWRALRRVSQLELSLQSAVSQRHLSFLESGRSQPSRAMVLQLSDALEVPLRERNALLQSAGFAPAYHERTLEAADMQPVRKALERMLEHHEPYPAVVVNRDYDVLMENRAFVGMTSLFGDREALWQACCPDGPPNLLRLTLHPRGARPFIRNFEEFAPLMLQRLYRETSIPGTETSAAFLAELRKDGDFPRRWHEPDPAATLAPVLPVTLEGGDVRLSLFSMISTFGTPYDVTTDEIRVETFFPADAGSAAMLRRLPRLS